MNAEVHSSALIARLIKQSGLISIWFCLIIAVSNLIGWFAGIEILRSILKNSVPMFPYTAMALIICSVAVLSRDYRSRYLSFIGLLIGAITITEYLLGIKVLPIPEIQQRTTTLYQAPSALETAICITLSSISILTYGQGIRRKKILGELCALLSASAALLALIGYFVEATTKTSIFSPAISGVGMAFNTALALIFLNIGILNLTAKGETSLFASETSGGVIVRRLISAIIIAPIAILIYINFLIHHGFLEDALRIPLTIMLGFSVMLIFTWGVARKIEGLDLYNLELQNKLIESEENYKLLINTASDGIFVADTEGKYIYVNEAGEKILNRPSADIVGKTINDLIPESDFQRLEESRRSMLGGMNHLGEWKLKRGDGSFIDVEVSAKILADGRWQGFVRDISEKKILEKKERFLLDLNEILTPHLSVKKRLEEAAKLLIKEFVSCCVIDQFENDGRRSFVIKEKIQNVTNVCYSLNTDTLNKIRKIIDKKNELFLRGKEIYQFLQRLNINTEDLKYLSNARSLIILPLIGREKTIGMIYFISEGREYQGMDLIFARLVSSRIALLTDNAILYEDMMRASRLREELIAIVSHDLKNPLSVIKLAAEIIQRMVTSKNADQSKIHAAINRIEATANQALSLITDLLINSKIESGHLEIEKQPVSALKIVEEVMDTLKPLASNKKITLSFATADSDFIIDVDKSRILQVLTNIVGNAIKFTPESGSINIDFKTFNDNEVLFGVHDTGQGIEAEHLQHIFDRYWQPKETRKQGTGLGLNIAKGIIEAHGGRIWAESSRDKGSHFYFTVALWHVSDRWNKIERNDLPLS